MAEYLEEFKLPVPLWYDSQGRIYKDRLIENFNAIEQRLIYISKLNSTVESVPDISKVVYPDVTLSDNDNKIINLKSFLDIMHLYNYPIELVFSGDNICSKVAYFDNNCKYIVLPKDGNGIKLDTSNTNKYIYLDYVNGNVFATGESTTPEGCTFIGVYDNGRIMGINTSDYININLLYYLPNMKNSQHPYTFSAGTRDSYNVARGIVVNNRSIGAADTSKKTGGSNPVIFRDTGRRLG